MIQECKTGGVGMLWCWTFWSRRGAAQIEYALIAALVAIASIGALMMLGKSVNMSFWKVTNFGGDKGPTYEELVAAFYDHAGSDEELQFSEFEGLVDDFCQPKCPTQRELQDEFLAADQDSDTNIDFDEFEDLIEDKREPPPPPPPPPK